jgi:hypothetical protein
MWFQSSETSGQARRNRPAMGEKWSARLMSSLTLSLCGRPSDDPGLSAFVARSEQPESRIHYKSFRNSRSRLAFDMQPVPGGQVQQPNRTVDAGAGLIELAWLPPDFQLMQ